MVPFIKLHNVVICSGLPGGCLCTSPQAGYAIAGYRKQFDKTDSFR
jgi:hypothetical protein